MNMSSKWGAIALIAILLSGCTVGPNFQAPQTQMPADWVPPTSQPTTNQSVATAEIPEIGKWWEVFHDPTLNSLIDRAYESNLDLKVAETRIREARATRIIATAALWPSLDSSASYTRAGIVRSGPTDLYRAGLDASWEIDVFGGNRRNVEAATAELESSIESRRDVLVTLMSEVALTYIDLRSFQREIEIAYENLDAQRHSADLTRRRLVAGFVSRLDTANADASVASTESTIPSLQASVRQSIYALSVLLGQQPAALVSELSETASIPLVPARVPVGLPSDLLRRRPDIRQAEANLHAATADIGVAVSDLYPRFSLDGSFSYQGDRPGHLMTLQNGAWAIGPSVSWNIFDAGRIRANIEFQKAAAEASLLAYQSTILTALQDVENSLVAYETEQHHYKYIVISVDANRLALDISTQLYANGQTTFLDVLNAQRSLFGAQTAQVDSERTIATNLVSLYKALGGGWEFEEQPTSQPTTQPEK
jgi:NodT family efflux transporter outer membrane factor (OMF) lipoprotein